MNKKNTINIITRIAILASLASCISIIDKIISASLFPFLPGIKIGIANVIILVSLLKLLMILLSILIHIDIFLYQCHISILLLLIDY